MGRRGPDPRALAPWADHVACVRASVSAASTTTVLPSAEIVLMRRELVIAWLTAIVAFWLIQNELSSFGSVYLMLLGALAIVIMLFFPKGIWGTLAERFDLHLFPIRRRLEIVDRAGSPDDIDLRPAPAAQAHGGKP